MNTFHRISRAFFRNLLYRQISLSYVSFQKHPQQWRLLCISYIRRLVYIFLVIQSGFGHSTFVCLDEVSIFPFIHWLYIIYTLYYILSLFQSVHCEIWNSSSDFYTNFSYNNFLYKTSFLNILVLLVAARILTFGVLSKRATLLRFFLFVAVG